MATYYGFLWIVAVLGVLRCLVQMAEVHASHPTLYNSLWLLTRFGEPNCSAKPADLAQHLL